MSTLQNVFLDNPVMRSYLFYSAILVVKMMAMSVLTSIQRLKNKAFANPEDCPSPKIKPTSNENVERVRRAHLNDLENIPLFFVIGFIYTLTNPSLWLATMLFRVYAGCRVLHTFVYAIHPLPQPSRALSWMVGYGITGYMAFCSLCAFW